MSDTHRIKLFKMKFEDNDCCDHYRKVLESLEPIGDWTELSDEEYNFLQKNLNNLPQQGWYEKYVIVREEDVQEKLKDIKSWLANQKAKIEREQAKRKEKAQQARLKKLKQKEEDEKKLLEELKKKYA